MDLRDRFRDGIISRVEQVRVSSRGRVQVGMGLGYIYRIFWNRSSPHKTVHSCNEIPSIRSVACSSRRVTLEIENLSRAFGISVETGVR